jgi:O-antigen ligase
LLDVVTTTGRYQKGVESGSREGLIDAGLQFLYSHFWGGINLYKSTHQLMPHNLFINMFLAGGYIGGFILLFIVCKQIYIILRFLIRTHYSDNWLPILFGLMYLVFTGNSLFHNMSIVYGDPLFFVFWGVCACYVETNRSKHPIYSRSKYKTYITKSL